jgi:purine-binding chemotaxis protein CheW
VRLGAERFAIGVAHLQEVLPMGVLTPVPATPAFVLGVTNVRGRVLAVLDLVPVLGAAEDEGARRHVVVVEAGGMRFGIAAADVDGPARRERADLAAGLVTELDLDALVTERRLEVGG